MDLAAPYPNVEQAVVALSTHLPQRTKRYSRNIPNPTLGESWLRLILISGELIKLQTEPHHAPIIVAVHPSASEWKQGFLENFFKAV